MKIETVKLWPGREDVTLTAYVMEENPLFKPEKRPPAVIVCPGGAYLNLSRDTEGDLVAMDFCAGGYQAFVLAYTVAQTAGGNSTQFPAQLLDIGKAMLTLRENAARWNLDADRITVMGFSAGAHLCATLATQWHRPLLAETLGAQPEHFRPAAAVMLYGLFDYVAQREYEDRRGPHPMHAGGPNMYEVTFGTRTPTQRQLEAYSPCLQVDENIPPCFLACAADDDMVPAFHTLRMGAALYEKKVPFTMHMFEKGAHGFSLGQTLTARNRRDKDWSCAAWVPLARDFIMQHTEPETAEGSYWPEFPGHNG